MGEEQILAILKNIYIEFIGIFELDHMYFYATSVCFARNSDKNLPVMNLWDNIPLMVAAFEIRCLFN